jgi:hypothetical protein
MTLQKGGGPTTTDSFDLLDSGEHVQVIGSCSSDTPSAVMATRIFRSPAAVAGPSDEASSPGNPVQASGSPSPDTLCGYSYTRLATWQCCGGVNACGSGAYSGCNPPPASRGKCGTCRTDQYGIAWPNTYDVNGQNKCEVPTQGDCSSCCPQLPFLLCGTSVNVYGMCTQKSVTMPIVDCGPVPRCTTTNTGCLNYHRIAFDLTACAFTALGGGLDYGHLDVQCTVYLQC